MSTGLVDAVATGRSSLRPALLKIGHTVTPAGPTLEISASTEHLAAAGPGGGDDLGLENPGGS
jgi:hypothetical protein